jgi:energy-coupling factor transport system permease protein
VLLIAVTLSILFAREPAPWSRSLGFYLATGALVITIRVLFRIVFNYDSNTDVAINLPVIKLPLGAFGEVDLLGRVSTGSLLSALRDGLRMAGVILSIGLANTLANPRKLLKNTPGALYEVAAAVVIAINMAPQLISSAKRVQQAKQLRGRSGRQNLLSGLLIPVLEDTLDRSLDLAATMDARGFGRRGNLTNQQLLIARVASMVAVTGPAIGAYLLLTQGGLLVPASLFALGLFGTFLAIRTTSLKHVKTQYRPSPWTLRDSAILVLALAIGTMAVIGMIS